MKKFSIKLISLILSIAIILVTVPLTVFATTRNKSEDANTIITDEAMLGNITSDIYELTDRRDEYTKHFRLEDGSVIAAQYDDPVHYLDENNNWQDIDNTLSDVGSEYSTSNAKIKFAKKITGNESLFTLHDGNAKITMSLDGAIKKTAGTVINHSDDNEMTKLQKMMSLEKISATIVYADILDGVDLEYIVKSDYVKENIIVKERQNSYAYTFTLKLNNLDAVLNSDGSISIIEPGTDNIVYAIPAPIVYDDNYNYAPSEAAYYLLDKIGTNKYSLTVQVDSEWMNAEERVYPVVVDPTVYKGGRKLGQMRDTYVSSANPGTNYGGQKVLRAGYDPTYGYTRSYIYLKPLPTLPKGSYITSAEINLQISSISELNDITLAAYTIDMGTTSLWSETKTTWSTHPAQFSPLLDYVNIEYMTETYDWSWDITEAAKKWYSGALPNHGICIGLLEESLTSTNCVVFHASESDSSAAGSYLPFYSFTYRDAKGLEDYYSYLASSAGTAGTGYVNHATGNLVLTKPLISTTDSLMPYTVALTYNSALPKLPYQYSDSIMTAYTTGYSPYGFKLNFQETLIKKSYINSSHATAYHYIWADADGTEHYFLPIEGDPDKKYQDDDGLKLTLSPIPKDNPTELLITDLDHTTRRFSKMSSAPSGTTEAWYLTSITDKNGNAVSFTFDSAYRPTAVNLVPNGGSPINFLSLAYNSNGLLYLVWNPTSKEAVVLRYASTYYVSQIDHAHGNDNVTAQNWLDFYNDASVKTNITVDASAKYTYSSGYITSALDTLSGYKIAYSYSSGKVSAVQEYGGSSVGQKLTLSYYPGYTEIRTSGSDDVHGNDDDIITTYAFDNALRCISSHSTDINGYVIYGASSGEYVSGNEKAKNSIKTSSVISDIATNYLLNSNFEINGISALNYWNTTGSVSTKTLEYNPLGSPATYNRNAYDSDYNVKLTVSSGTTSTLYQNVVLRTGKYTLSAAVLSDLEDGVTVRLKVQSLDNTSTIYTKNFDFYKDSNFPIEAEESLTFEVSGTSTSEERFKVSLEVVGGSGISSTDIRLSHVTLSKAAGYSMNSRVNYGSFEMSTIASGSSRYPLGTFWKPSSSDFSVTTAPQSDLSGNSLYIEGGGINKSRSVYQIVYRASAEEKAYFISNPTDYVIYPKQYRVSGRALSSNALHSYFSSFEISVRVEYVNSNGATSCQTYSFPFNDYCTSWQFVSGVFTTTPNCFVNSITIYCKFDGQTGGAYFDDVSLCFLGTDTSPSAYNYDPDTGLLTEELSMYSRICYVYNEEDKTQLVRKIDKYSITDYSYDNNHRVNQVEYYSFAGDWTQEKCGYTNNPSKTLRSTTTYEYNAYGQQIRETITSSSGILVSTKTYRTDSPSSKIFGALLSETDALGRTTRYFYNENKGLLLASIGPDGNGVAYTYDGMGRMTLVRPASVSSESSSGYVYYTNAEAVSYIYNSTGALGTILTDTTTYNFTYDAFGNSSAVLIGNHQLASYTYNANNGKLSSMTYGNGVSVKYDYDELDRTVKIWYKGSGASSYSVAYEYEYDASGNLCTFYDRISDQITTYRYDDAGRLCEYYVTAEDDFQAQVLNIYDNNGRVRNQGYSYEYVHNGVSHTLIASSGVNYKNDGAVADVFTHVGEYEFYTAYDYDILGRQTQSRTTLYPTHGGSSVSADYQYTYSAGANGGTTSLRIASVKTTVGSSTENYSYTYDSCGRITHIYLNGTLKYSYAYDDLGQLVRENNTTRNKTYIYTYDTGGNITSKKEYPYTTAATVSGNPTTYSYTYGNSVWGDLLTEYRGTEITYDGVGNPLSYYNGYSYTFTWTQGRRLATAVRGSNTLSFEYNDEGIRTSKTVNGITHYYQLAGSQILSENWIDESGIYHVVIFIYDENGSPMGMSYSNSTYAEDVADNYLFVKNMQGDIVHIYDDEGNKIVSYQYDAWGTVTSYSGSNTNAYKINPFRYRGYYYDVETRLYYLNSRYYDPEMGRFINADSVMSGTDGSLQGANLFAYCFNNPVNLDDSDGNWPNWLKKTVAAVAVVAVVAAAAAVTVSTAGTGTAIACVVMGAAKGAAIGFAVGATTGAAGGAISHRLSTGSWEGAGEAALNGMADGALSGAITGAITGGMNSNVCFVAGTLVETETGSLPIEEISLGMKVYAHNPDTGETELKEVVNTFVRQSDELVHIKVNGEHIITTPEHPFYVPVKGWTSAIQLRAGDRLQLLNGKYVIIEQVQHELLETPVTVYNFEVEDFHTYYVTDSAILVHNVCGAKNALPKNGIKVNSSEALGLADDFLGKGYSEMSPGRFVSSDGLRQVRMTASDLATVNNHAGAPHFNFETLAPNPLKPGKFKITGKSHVFIFD